MSNEEANQILKELYEVRPEKLNDKAKRLFEAIMKIVDERDSVKADLYEANNRINDLLDIVKQKNKKIDTKNAEIECLNIIHESYKEMVKENNYISKDKIKARIEELENQKRQWIEDRDNKHKDSEIIYAIEVLQSLLEKE